MGANLSLSRVYRWPEALTSILIPEKLGEKILVLYLNIRLFICSLLFSLQWTTNKKIELCRRGLQSKGSSFGSMVIFTGWDLCLQLSLENQDEKGLTPYFSYTSQTQMGLLLPCKDSFLPHPCDVKHKAAHFSYFLDRGNNFLICPEGART